MRQNSLSIVFPGQGSQTPGMLTQVAHHYPELKTTIQEASDTLGYDMWALCQDNPDDKLNLTEFTQPALLASSVAMWRVLQSQIDCQPALLAGHSLGEYSALVCAGAISFADGLRLVAKRGQLMQHAVPAGKGAMAAIIGLDDEDVVLLCEDQAHGQIVTAANYNSPGQVVVAGDKEAVERVVANSKSVGAKLAKILAMSVPSHCALMRPAAEAFTQDLYNVVISTPKIPVIHNVDATSKTDVAEIRQALIHQLHQPVLWVDCVDAMIERGAQTFIECGPGKVLTGLIKRIDRDVACIALSDINDYSELAQACAEREKSKENDDAR